MANDDIGRDGSDASAVLRELESLRTDLLAEARHAQHRLDAIHPNYQASARNLLYYLALRRRDLRPLQQRLAALGLSSLGRSESHVLATIDAVLALLRRLGHAAGRAPQDGADIDFATGKRLLDQHTDLLLGPEPAGRRVRIMVTMPGEAADDPDLVHRLLEHGMDCIRINCAHDDAQAWSRIIANLRRAEQALGRSCKVAMDLAGPKLRTGPVQAGPQVLRIRPTRDLHGRIVAPARVWLTADPDAEAPSEAQACLSLPEAWLARLRKGDRITLTDARALDPGRPADIDAQGHCMAPARIGCTLGQISQQLQANSDEPPETRH